MYLRHVRFTTTAAEVPGILFRSSCGRTLLQHTPCVHALGTSCLHANTSHGLVLLQVMSYIYDEIYVEYVIKNPLYSPGAPFRWVFQVHLKQPLHVPGVAHVMTMRHAINVTDRSMWDIAFSCCTRIEQFNNALNGYLRSRSLLQSI